MIVSFMTIMFFGVTFGKTLTNSKKHLGSVFSALVVIAGLWLSALLGSLLEMQLIEGVHLTLNPWRNMPFLGEGTQPVIFPLVSPLMFVALGLLAFAVTSWLMDRKLNL
jgi:Na+/phosphate symporter